MKKTLILLIVPFIAFAQFNFIPVGADYASFGSVDNKSFVQVYLSFFQHNLSYSYNSDDVFSATFSTKLEISQGDSLIRSIQHNYQNTASDTTKIANYNQFIDVFNLDLPQGSYNAKVLLTDKNSGKTGEYNFDLIPCAPKKGLYLSDIQLCTKIVKDTSQSLFLKNGLHVVPNARAVFDALNPLFYYYVELNNLSYSEDQMNRYSFEYWITNSKGDTLRQKAPVTKDVINSRLVEIGGMNVIAFPKGVYIFHSKATDLKSGSSDISSKKFFVYKPERASAQQGQNTALEIENHYIGLTEQKLDEEFEFAFYLTDKTEKSVYESLPSVLAKQKFLTAFWNRQDSERGLAHGSFRKLYLKRVNIADEKYTILGRQGWKTDMGRVFIIYGEPNEYERHPSSMDLLPYVIWHYHSLEGGAQFIFADEQGFGQYRLIHSTYRKELQNPNWQSIILKRAANTDINSF